MDVREFLLNNSQELREYTESIHYKLSKEIIKLRYILSFSVEEMSEQLGITLEHYLKLESAFPKIEIDEFNRTIEKQIDLVNKSVSDILTKAINREPQRQIKNIETNESQWNNINVSDNLLSFTHNLEVA